MSGENATVDHDALERLIADVTASGGAEMANAQPFIERLTAALGLPQPDFAREENRFNDYVFERSVDFKHPDGSTTRGRIDCYKRDCFVLEAKQSAKRKGKAPNDAQIELLPDDATGRKLGPAKRGTRSWDKVMLAARKQAEDYARALPVDHGYPPFLLIVDVGTVIEVYADFPVRARITPISPTGRASASPWTICAIRPSRSACMRSGPIRCRSIRRRNPPRSPATSPNGSPASPGGSKDGTIPRTSPSS